MQLKFGNFLETRLQELLAQDATELNPLPSFSAAVAAVLDGSGAIRFTLFDGVQAPEIIEVVEVSADTLIISRGMEDTSPSAWNSGTTMRCALTAELMNLMGEFFGGDISTIQAGTGRAVYVELEAADSQTAFDITPLAPTTIDDVWVYVNGVRQFAPVCELSGSSEITFLDPLREFDVVRFECLRVRALGSVEIGDPPGDEVTPVAWADVIIGDTTYKLALFQ